MVLVGVGFIVCGIFLYFVFKNVNISEKRDEKLLKKMTKRKNKK